jgi:hypothetical protein
MIILVADQDTGTPDESLRGRLSPALHFGFKRVKGQLTNTLNNLANDRDRQTTP